MTNEISSANVTESVGIGENRYVEGTNSTSQAREVTISGISSEAELVGKVITIKSINAGTGGGATLKVNSLSAYPIVGAAPAGTMIYDGGPNTGWVASGQSYSVVLEESGTSYRYVLITKNLTIASTGEHGMTQLMTSITSESEAHAATAKSVKMIKGYVDEIASSIKSKSIILSKENWNNMRQSVEINDLDLTKEIDMGIPVPTTRENATMVVDCEIIVESVGNNTLTFCVTETPSANISVVIRGIKKSV